MAQVDHGITGVGAAGRHIGSGGFGGVLRIGFGSRNLG
jgi:hypothetical protein